MIGPGSKSQAGTGLPVVGVVVMVVAVVVVVVVAVWVVVVRVVEVCVVVVVDVIAAVCATTPNGAARLAAPVACSGDAHVTTQMPPPSESPSSSHHSDTFLAAPCWSFTSPNDMYAG